MSVKVRERTLPSGKKQIYLDIYHKGQRRRETLQLEMIGDRKADRETRDLADKIRAKRQLDLANASEGFASSNRKKTNFFLYAESVITNKSDKTKATYTNMLRYLEAYSGGDLIFESITANFCEKFRTSLLDGKTGYVGLRGINKRNTAAAYYERFRIILKRAVDDGIITQNPSKGISIQLQETLPKYLTQNQLSALAKTECGNKIVRDAFFFSCVTGIRYGDIVRLCWKNIHDNSIHLIQSKTGHSQVIDLNSDAKAILKKYKGDGNRTDELVFSFPRRSSVDKVLKSWGKRAGLDVPLSFHKARHSFATLMLSTTGDIYTTSKILGHKSLATTQIYAKVVDEKKKAALQGLPKIKGL
ncbi:MAG: tyrosine-type recombinase/integrase [Bacteroidota bacterium]|jgi:integrase